PSGLSFRAKRGICFWSHSGSSRFLAAKAGDRNDNPFEVLPGKQFRVRWGNDEFAGTGFEERFEVVDPAAKPVATFAGGAAAAYEHTYGKGNAIILGTLAGEFNQTNPVAMHPLGDILTKWAGIRPPQVKASSYVELRTMTAATGTLAFLFNHGDKSARVEYSATLARPARKIAELSSGSTIVPQGTELSLKVEVPAEAVRVYRIDY
ncbi:MAG: hypothetical protein ACE14L_17965, partial [Terriglobales bacterium]